METTTLSERLAMAMDHAGMNQSAILRAAEKRFGDDAIKQALLSKIELGKQKSSGKYGPQISDILRVNLLWLSTGDGPMTDSDNKKQTIFTSVSIDPDTDSNVQINQYKDIRFSCGKGMLNDMPEVVDTVSFKESWMHKNNLKPESCFCCYADGQSMAPRIAHGDIVLINLDEQDIYQKNDLVFAFLIGDECRIKRVFTTTTGVVRLVSDNPNKADYPDELISQQEMDQLQVAGRVRWSGSDH